MLNKINQDQQIELIRNLLVMKLRHHASTTLSVRAGRWLDTALCLNIAGHTVESKNWVKMEKKEKT